MEEWWNRNEKFKSSEQTKEDIEDITGCVPLLLSSAVKGGEIDLAAAAELQVVSTNVQRYVEMKYGELEKHPRRWER